MSVKREILFGIEALAVLPFNWNRFVGLPLRPDVQTYAARLFDVANVGGYGISPDLLERAGKPEIILSQDGTVDLVFTRSRTLAITLYCYGVAGYRKAFEDNQTEIEGLIRSDGYWPKCGEFNELLTWLIQE